jgi:Flp pilus assembly protein TadD
MAAADPDNAAIRVALSQVLASLGNEQEAIATALEAGRIEPARPEPLEQLASIYADSGDGPRLQPIADELVRRFPARDEGRYYQAAASFLTGRAADADRVIRALLTANPAHAKGHNLRGIICGSAGDQACAKAAFEQSMRLDPSDPSVYVNLGHLYLEKGEASTAAKFFGEALALDMTSASTREALDRASTIAR